MLFLGLVFYAFYHSFKLINSFSLPKKDSASLIYFPRSCLTSSSLSTSWRIPHFDGIIHHFPCFIFLIFTNTFFISKKLISYRLRSPPFKNPSKSRSCWYLMAAILHFSQKKRDIRPVLLIFRQ